MRQLIIFSLVIFSLVSHGQARCHCENNTTRNESGSCDTIRLKNKAILYYQYDCDSTWLTLKNKYGKEVIVFSSGLIEINYRLGYNFIKEFDKGILFRYGCPANGPCDYVLADKTSGETIKQFGPLVYDSEDMPTNFILYFPKNSLDYLTLYNIETNKTFKIKVPAERFRNSPVPSQQFTEPLIEKDMLILKYEYRDAADDLKTDVLKIDLTRYNL